ncbi:MAG: hypothetical protein K2W95_29450 [Candidatus Obscuribacterales bacterium]|nr:hypothetical protein [Candidatus Obscuribacterales bacterium]
MYRNNESQGNGPTLRPFVEWLIASGKSAETARVYASRVRGFLEHLPDVELNCLQEISNNPETIFKESATLSARLEQYLLSREKSGVSKRTAEAIRTAVRSYFVSLNRPLFSEQIGGKEGNRMPDAAAHLVDASTSSAKVRLIYALIGADGLTNGECASIKMIDLKFTSTETYVEVTRRGRPYLIKLCRSTRKALADWLVDRSKMMSDADALLLNVGGNAMSSNGIDYLVRAAAHKQFVDLSPKSLRTLALR